MMVAFLSSPQRYGLAGAAAVLFVLLLLLGRRHQARRYRWVAAIAVALVLCVGTLALERLVALFVASAAPAESDFNEYHWVLMAPWSRGGLIAGVIAAILACGIGWWTSGRLGDIRHRIAVMILRAVAAAAALVLFLEPAIELREVAREPNHVAVLIDDSRSMSLSDAPGGPSRFDKALAVLEGSGDAFAAWRQGHVIDVYRFADSLVASSAKSVARGEPLGDTTRMRQALDQVRNRYERDELAGVVLISDGVGTGGFVDAGEGTTAEFLRMLETRVHTVWTGETGLRDVAVARVLADEFAFVRTVVRVEVVVRATGYERTRLPVTLSMEGYPLRQTWVEFDADTPEVTVAFEFTPPRVGKFVYEVSTPVGQDEAVSSNNRRAFVLRVIRDKIRVLQVAGQPSWDVHALRSMLKQNPNVDLISFFILRTPDDHSGVANSELSLIPFPTRELFQEELPSFDVIVLQDFAYGPYGIGAYLENIRSYVAGGGALVMLGGPHSFSSGGYVGTPVAEALPLRLLGDRRLMQRLRPGFSNPLGTDGSGADNPLLDTEMFRPRLTQVGRTHPVTALRYRADDNLQTWLQLPQFEGVNMVGDVKRDAVALAVHPKLRTARGTPMPVIVAGRYQDGRTMVVTTDSLWRWGFVAAGRGQNDGRYFAKFWQNAIRWLIRDPELELLRVESDATEYGPGETVRLDVQLFQRDYQPLGDTPVSLRVDRGSDPAVVETVATVELSTGADGRAHHELSALDPGVYRVTGTAKVDGQEVRGQDILVMKEVGVEFEHPAADDALLRTIAAMTGAQYLGQVDALPYDLPFEPPRIVRVDQRTDVELWSRPSLLLLALLCLGLEWGLRQRSGYL